MKQLHTISQALGDKTWWKSMGGNILSTMIGIVLTIGVGAIYQHHSDKQMAKEMMFHVLMRTEEHISGPLMTDSIYKEQMAAIKYFMHLYKQTDGNLEMASQTEPKDTLDKYTKQVFCGIYNGAWRSQTEKYFYSAQTMHQFGNPQLYADFALLIQNDEIAYDYIEKRQQECVALYRSFNSRIASERKTSLQVLNDMIVNRDLTELFYTLVAYNGEAVADGYRNIIDMLLKEMGATKEDFEEYKKSHEISDDEGSESGNE